MRLNIRYPGGTTYQVESEVSVPDCGQAAVYNCVCSLRSIVHYRALHTFTPGYWLYKEKPIQLKQCKMRRGKARHGHYSPVNTALQRRRYKERGCKIFSSGLSYYKPIAIFDTSLSCEVNYTSQDTVHLQPAVNTALQTAETV
ncbi:hypothetical protein J6590_036496 [Homalodisca vitripennis]|nr:hypothetical protein J6590_036496 [Homalodisca vitripennis]